MIFVTSFSSYKTKNAELARITAGQDLKMDKIGSINHKTKNVYNLLFNYPILSKYGTMTSLQQQINVKRS